VLVLSPETEGGFDILVVIQKRRRFDPNRKPRVGAMPDPAEFDWVDTTDSGGATSSVAPKRKRLPEDCMDLVC
jgi:hypothetical protein